jgi:hypothetical protein
VVVVVAIPGRWLLDGVLMHTCMLEASAGQEILLLTTVVMASAPSGLMGLLLPVQSSCCPVVQVDEQLEQSLEAEAADAREEARARGVDEREVIMSSTLLAGDSEGPEDVSHTLQTACLAGCKAPSVSGMPPTRGVVSHTHSGILASWCMSCHQMTWLFLCVWHSYVLLLLVSAGQ